MLIQSVYIAVLGHDHDISEHTAVSNFKIAVRLQSDASR